MIKQCSLHKSMPIVKRSISLEREASMHGVMEVALSFNTAVILVAGCFTAKSQECHVTMAAGLCDSTQWQRYV